MDQRPQTFITFLKANIVNISKANPGMKFTDITQVAAIKYNQIKDDEDYHRMMRQNY
jgi:hypothetical protein